MGSLVAAVGSFLDARARGGEWLVRIEDLDPPREIAGAADDILRTLEVFGLHWDRQVWRQSERHHRYAEVLEQLRSTGHAFGCNCTRAMLAGHPVYPGTCRGQQLGKADRFQVPSGKATWQDRMAGHQQFDWTTEIGDFVLRRSDGFWAYHLAVVVDDHDSGVTDVVRGADLLDSTARHLALMQALHWPVPSFMHLPLVVNALGQKLSKQTLAPPVKSSNPAAALQAVFDHLHLGIQATPDLDDSYSRATEAWAGRHLTQSQ